MGRRWALSVLAYLLSHSSASAGKLQVSRTSERQAAKARLSGEVDALARAIRSGLVVGGRQPPGLLAELARERLGMEADDMETPGGELLRAFVGRAPDSVLVMPMAMAAPEEEDEVEAAMPGDELEAGAPGGQQFVVVEEDEEADPTAELRLTRPRLPDFVHGPLEDEPRMAETFRRDNVREAARHLATDMEAIQESLGRDALESIVHEFFALHGGAPDEPREPEQPQAFVLAEPAQPARPTKSSRGTIAAHAAAPTRRSAPTPPVALHTAAAAPRRSESAPEPLVAPQQPAAAGNSTSINRTAPAAPPAAHANNTFVNHTAGNKTVASAAMVEKERPVVHAAAETQHAHAALAHEVHHEVAAEAHRGVANLTATTNVTLPPMVPSVGKTWHDKKGTTFRRRCSGQRCSTRVMRRRSR